jgi:tetratricopeptide (TPR) repeat protein
MILELEPGAPEYGRMIEILEKHDDVGALYRCYTARLNHLDVQGDQAAKVEILLSRARLRTGIADIRGASRDLKALLLVEPEHQDALLDRARLLERSGDASAAAEHYQLFLAVSTDPERRSSAELSLSYLLVESLHDLQGAIGQLREVVAQSPDDIELRERLITLLLQGKLIDDAIGLIRGMSELRQSEGERARDELRIAAVQRDADRPKAAVESLEKARKHDPLNMDVVRDLIELCGGEEERHQTLLADILRDVRAAVASNPLQAGLYQRLVTIAQWSEDAELHHHALEALSFAASLSAEQVEQFESLSGTEISVTRQISDKEWHRAVVEDESNAFAAEVWSIIGPAVSEISGATASGLGFERGQRTKGKAVAKSFPIIAEMVSHAGVEDLEVYASDTSASVARSISVDVPTLLLGTGIVRAATPAQRFALARAIAHARAGTGTAAGLAPARLCLYFAAAANVAGVAKLRGAWTQRVDASALSTVAKSLAKAIGRKGRKDLAALAERFPELNDPVLWQRASQSTAANIGLLFCGSLAAAFDVLDVGRGGRPIDGDPVAQALMAWSVSPDYIWLRTELGLAGGK